MKAICARTEIIRIFIADVLQLKIELVLLPNPFMDERLLMLNRSLSVDETAAESCCLPAYVITSAARCWKKRFPV